MSEIEISKINGYRIGSRVKPSRELQSELIRFFESRDRAAVQPLNGRGNVVFGELSSIGRVVVKRYLRGGVLRHLVRTKYFRCGATRGESEFRLLERARELGVNAPEPLFFADKGWPLYDAWLVTREIQGKINFADLCKGHEEKAMSYIKEFVRQLSLLIESKVFHVDLHPGNVVIDQSDKVFILDFDKTKEFLGSKNALRDLYLVRWRRAVIKHSLPEWVSEMVCPGLRRNFEG